MPRPTGGRAHAQKRTAAQVADEQIRCYQLRLTGATIQMIANQTGLSVGTVHSRIQCEVKERVEPLADEVRKMQLDRMDEWLLHLNRQIREGRAVARNIEICLRVEERRAKLLGVDAPEVKHVSIDTAPEVAALLARADAYDGG